MAKFFGIAPILNGVPNIAPLVAGVDYKGFVLCDQVAGFGAYLFSGTPAQLIALNALSSVVGIVQVTENGGVKWAELDGTIAPAVRTKLNTWLSNRGYPTIPVGWSYRQVVIAVYQRVNNKFDLNEMDVAD